jgi:hypothetical protein
MAEKGVTKMVHQNSVSVIPSPKEEPDMDGR